MIESVTTTWKIISDMNGDKETRSPNAIVSNLRIRKMLLELKCGREVNKKIGREHIPIN